MKSINIFFALVFSIASFSAQAQKAAVQKENITVYGNCGMCKSRIEKAAVAAGATAASWNDETKILAVSYGPTKSSAEKIEKAVAAVGHDTKNFIAKDEVYNKLHGCCQYERKATDAKADVAASCCKSHEQCTADKCCDMAAAKVDCCKATEAKSACCTEGKSCCAKS